MPTLNEITYSRKATIAAVRDYYHFLVDMFLPENFVHEPPAEGWPTITKERVTELGKNDEVYELMRRLPYIADETQLIGHASVAYWPKLLTDHVWVGGVTPFEADDVRIITEGLDWEDVPPSAFGLICGGRNSEIFILDTRFGTVHWLEAPDFDRNPIRKPVTEPSGGSDPFEDCAPENEHGWRKPAWSIPDFFEILKNELRTLKHVPVEPQQIDWWFDEYETKEDLDEFDARIVAVRHAYQEHGWPDMSVYNKVKCQDVISRLNDEATQRWNKQHDEMSRLRWKHLETPNTQENAGVPP